MSFQTPLALVGLLVVPLLVALYIWRDRGRRAFSARFGNPDLMPKWSIAPRVGDGTFRIVVLLVALAAMIVGVARPHATLSVKREEATVVLAIDTSRSMKATDVAPTRTRAARGAAEDFIEDVPDRFRIGVVAFASRAGVAVPPTEDRALVATALGLLKPGEGTALGDAIVLSTTLGQRQRSLDGKTMPPTSVLLISDGRRTVVETVPEDCRSRRAKQAEVPIYTVLIGTADGVVEETLTGGYRRIIQVPPRPETLEQIAEISDGEFFATPEAQRLRGVRGPRLAARNEGVA